MRRTLKPMETSATERPQGGGVRTTGEGTFKLYSSWLIRFAIP